MNFSKGNSSEVQYEPPAPMTAAQRALIEKENHYRQLFANNPTSSELSDPYVLLEDVYEHQSEYVYQNETEEEKRVPKLLTQHRRLDLTGPAIVSRNEWINRWNKFTNGILNGLNWSNVFCAGGAILGTIIPDDGCYQNSDIDLFLYGLDTDEAANQKLREIYELIVKNTGNRGDVIRTEHAVTVLNAHPYRHTQIILRMYRSPAEVLIGFDIDSCTIGFDGTNIYAMERFKRALTKRYNLVNVSRRSLTYEQRLAKYSRRGFAVAVPDLDKSKVNQSLQYAPIKTLYGLAKLLAYDFQAQKSINFSRRNKTKVAESGDSDYNNGLDIPWAPYLSIKNIMHILKVRDRASFFGQYKKLAKQPKKEFGEQQPKPQHLFHTIFLDSTGADGKPQPKIQWVRNNPAYQDLDGSFVRQLMTGSFNLPTPVQSVWDKYCYNPSAQEAPIGLSYDQGYDQMSLEEDQPKGGKKPAKKIETVTSGFGSYSIEPPKSSTFPPIMEEKKKSFTSYEPKKFTVVKGPKEKKEQPQPQEKKTPEKKPRPVSSSTPAAEAGYLSSNFTTENFTHPTSLKLGLDSVQIQPPGGNLGPFGATTVPASFDISKNLPPGFGLPSQGFATQPQFLSTQPPFSTTQSTFSTAQNTYTQPPFTSQQPSQTAQGSSTVNLSGIESLLASHLEEIKKLLPTSSATLQPPNQEQAPATTKLFLLVSLCSKNGSITPEERASLKNLIIQRNEAIYSALEVFEIDQDLEDLVDTFKRIVKHTNNK